MREATTASLVFCNPNGLAYSVQEGMFQEKKGTHGNVASLAYDLRLQPPVVYGPTIDSAHLDLFENAGECTLIAPRVRIQGPTGSHLLASR